MRKILLLSMLIILISATLYACVIYVNSAPTEISAYSIIGGESEHCRMWGMVSPSLSQNVVMSQLVSLRESLKNLGGGPDGPGNVNGWGLVYYVSGISVVARGQPEAYTDNNFNAAAQALASSGAQVAMGHVRNAASGAVNIPDPHPFVRVYGGKTWTFAHNGGLNIANLKTLIGPTFLSYFTPTVGTSWNDPKVVDSDLYMIYILKCVEESNWDVKAGIAKAVTEIYATDSSSNANFLLSDGTSMWGYKKSVDSSHPLCYKYDASQHYSAIASQPPEGAGLGNWTSMSDFDLVQISVDSPPVLYQDITGYNWSAHTPIHLRSLSSSSSPTGLSPSQIRKAYNLPSIGGSGTIAIIDAYDDPTAQSDLDVFSSQFGLPLTSSGYFTKHKMSSSIGTNTNWALEISLDVEWAHAIAPNAKILLVEANSNSNGDLLAAVNYARNQTGVVAVSMSWGGSEFLGENLYDSYFTSNNGRTIAFFASSGDSGAGVSWPAVSSNVIGVGGTSLTFNPDGSVASETGWSGSGGGVSVYVSEPSYQSSYGISGANGKRGVPDVSYNAAPNSGMSVYDSTPYQGYTGWLLVYGTSAGSPQWAAIQSLGLSASNSIFYQDAKSSYSSYFRDILSGSNGVYTATTGYDYVTGLGSPLTTNFVPSAITFTASGLGSDASGTVITIDSTQYTITQLQSLTFNWAPGSTHTITASDPISAGSGKQYRWVSWTNGDGLSGVGPSTYTVPSTSQTVTANYKTQYKVSFAVNPSGTGGTVPLGTGVWEDAGSLSILASPNSGYGFTSWSSNTTFITFTSSTSESTSATIGGAGTITANFAPSSGTTIYVAARGPDNLLWWSTVNLNSKVQSGWNQLTGSSPSSPSIYVSGTTMYVAARGADNLLWWSTVDTGTKVQSSWNQLSGASPSPMSIYVSGTTMYVAVRGPDNLLWWSTVDTGTKVQSSWNQLTGSSPSAMSIYVSGTTMYVAARGADNLLWWSTVNLNIKVQSSWNQLTGSSPSAMSIYVSGTTMYVAVRDPDNLLWWSTVDTGTKVQSSWNLLSGSSPSPPSIYVSGTTMYVAARGADNLLWWSTVDTGTKIQSDWNQLTGSSPSELSININ